MEKGKEQLLPAESAVLQRVSEKHTVSVKKDDPELEIYILLAGRGLIKRLTSLDHPDSLVVSFITIDENRT